MRILLIVTWVTMTSNMYKGPLYPEHGMLYDVAMMEAEQEYNTWLQSRKGKKGVKVYAVRAERLKEARDLMMKDVIITDPVRGFYRADF